MGVGRVVEVDSGLEDGVRCYAEVAAERWHCCCDLRKDGGSWGEGGKIRIEELMYYWSLMSCGKLYSAMTGYSSVHPAREGFRPRDGSAFSMTSSYIANLQIPLQTSTYNKRISTAQTLHLTPDHTLMPPFRLRIPSTTHTLTTGRRYTTARPTHLNPSTPLTLNHFLQRQRVLSLYRRIVRSTNHIPSPSTKIELKELARAEFERNRAVRDLGQIRYLVGTGKTEFEKMERYAMGL